MTQPIIQLTPEPTADCPGLSPEQVTIIRNICQDRKVLFLTLLDYSPGYYDFLVDFRPEGILPWHAEDPFIAADLESALHAYVDITTPGVLQLNHDKGYPQPPYSHPVYQYAC